jgi:hypothetical protein
VLWWFWFFLSLLDRTDCITPVASRRAVSAALACVVKANPLSVATACSGNWEGIAWRNDGRNCGLTKLQEIWKFISAYRLAHPRQSFRQGGGLYRYRYWYRWGRTAPEHCATLEQSWCCTRRGFLGWPNWPTGSAPYVPGLATISVFSNRLQSML